MPTAVLAATSIGEVWGIGRRNVDLLKTEVVTNVLRLVQINPGTMRRRWSVVLERTVRELQGQPCVSLEDQPPPKKEIAFTRSFGQPVLRDIPVCLQISLIDCLSRKYKRLILANVPTLITPVSCA